MAEGRLKPQDLVEREVSLEEGTPQRSCPFHRQNYDRPTVLTQGCMRMIPDRITFTGANAIEAMENGSPLGITMVTSF